LTQPIINKISNIAGQKLTLMWIPNTTADGYQILYKNTSDSSTVVITGNSTINTTISGLTQGEKYMVYVRSYKTVSGIKYYSSWSLSQSIIIAK
jgi:hypothetical protein